MIVRAAFRDIQWRRRRVLMAVAGTSLVFAITLLLTGLSNGFQVEAERLLDDLHADAWAVQNGAAGPFLGQVPFRENALGDVRALPGVRAATPMVFGRKSVGLASPEEVNVFGTTGPGLRSPAVDTGRQPRSRGEIVVSSTLGYGIGDRITLSGRRFEVVGRVNAWTAVAGVPNVMITIADAQELVFAGMPVVSAIAVYGAPVSAPQGLVFIDNTAAKADLLRPLGNGTSAIGLVAFSSRRRGARAVASRAIWPSRRSCCRSRRSRPAWGSRRSSRRSSRCPSSFPASRTWSCPPPRWSWAWWRAGSACAGR
jgi:putative ABC transport system permease protein